MLTLSLGLMLALGEWGTGRAVWMNYCARCHGEDGRSETYAGTKSMAGIGRRLSREEIARRTNSTGSVDMSRFTRGELEALWKYVAGL
jgi:cytochrome c553